MDQFAALIWLKWTLFRNSLRSRKATLSRVASILGTVIALAFALLIALALGAAIYKVLSPGESAKLLAELPPDHPQAIEAKNIFRSGFILLFIAFSLLYLMWATVPLTLGGGNQFAPGRFLLYPVSLKKLFAMDVLSEFTNISSIFAVPIILAIGVGAGLALGNVLLALPVVVFAVACGISITKWLASSMSALLQKRRTRGETMIALVGVVVGLGGAFFGEFAAYMARRGGEFRGLRWTPPGAAAIGLSEGLTENGGGTYILALLTLAGYTALFVTVTFFIARRSALSAGGAKRGAPRKRSVPVVSQSGWHLPLVSAELSAVIEKELRYAMRNAQLRTMAVMPLVLIFIRLARGSRIGGDAGATTAQAGPDTFAVYADGLMVAGGVLYVFLILSSIACNLFAYEAGGMRAFILSPVDRRKILIGKNISVITLALVLCTALIVVNQLVFRDLTFPALVFAALCFVLFAASFSLIGNLLSIRFPKRLQYGKRMNASGVTGFLMIPILLMLAAPPVLATYAAYKTQSIEIKYATLALFTVLAILLYMLLITRQGQSLARHEQEVLEAVGGQGEET